AERQHGPAHRGVRLRPRGGARRDGGHVRPPPRQGRHQGVLPRHEGAERPGRSPLEAQEDVAIVRERRRGTGGAGGDATLSVMEETAPGGAAADDASCRVRDQDTLPKLFRLAVAEGGDKVAMREKDLGIWKAIPWRAYGQRARHVGLGLVALGLLPRDVVSIIADNCPEWLYTDLPLP